MDENVMVDDPPSDPSKNGGMGEDPSEDFCVIYRPMALKRLTRTKTATTAGSAEKQIDEAVPKEDDHFPIREVTKLIEADIKVECLEEAWPMVELYLSDLGYLCTLDRDELSITASPTTETKAASYSFPRVSHLLELLSTTNVPPSLAIELVESLREHVFMDIGPQEGGLCSANVINDDDFDKRREYLIASKEAIYKVMGITMYVTENTVTGVGDSCFHLKVFWYLVQHCFESGFHPIYILNTMAIEETNDIGRRITGWKVGFRAFDQKIMSGEVELVDKVELLGDDDMYPFSFPITDKRAKVLEEDRQMLESYLKELGITWTLDPVKCSMEGSISSKDPRTSDKAIDCLSLLGTTNVPPSLVIQIMNGCEQHVFIRTGTQKGGLCSTFGIEKDEFVKRRELLISSLEAIHNLTHCRIFVQGATATAVGASADALEMFRIIVEGCFIHNVVPADFIAKIKRKESNGMGDASDAITSFTQFFRKGDEKKLQYGWPMVKMYLQELGISCALNGVEHSMTVSTTGDTRDPNCSIAKARHLLELLATTAVPPSLAIEIVNGLRQHVLMKIGIQEGGLCSRFGIEKGEFIKRRERLAASPQAICNLAECDVYIKGGTFVAVGGYYGPAMSGLEFAKTVVESYIVHDVEPACVRKVIDEYDEFDLAWKSRKRKQELDDAGLLGKSSKKHGFGTDEQPMEEELSS